MNSAAFDFLLLRWAQQDDEQSGFFIDAASMNSAAFDFALFRCAQQDDSAAADFFTASLSSAG